MRRQAILLFILLCTTTILKGQEVVLSEELSLRNENAYYIIGKVSDKHLVLRERPGKFMLNAFHDDMSNAWERELELPKKRPSIIEIFDYKDRFFVLFEHKIKGQAQMRMHEYDSGANLIDSTFVIELSNSFIRSDFSIIRSENQKYIQVERIDGAESRKIFVYDLERMEVLYDHVFDPPNFNANGGYSKLLIDDEGSSYYVVERDNRKSKKKSHHFDIYGHESYTNRKIKFKVFMPGRLSYDRDVKVDNANHAMIIAGYYNDRQLTKADGTFYLRAPLGDPASSMLKLEPFDELLLETVEGKTKRQKNALSEIRVTELIPRVDGGVLILGEKYKRLSSGLPAGTRAGNGPVGFVPISSDYYFDDIFVVAHHPNGVRHWTNFFYKRQYSKNDFGMFSSYFVMKTPSKLRLIFNDEIIQNTTVSTYNLRPDGEYDRQALFNADFQNIKLRFIDSKQISGTEVIVPSEYRGELRLMKVKF